jgi:glycyl-radical enzyme activating protein
MSENVKVETATERIQAAPTVLGRVFNIQRFSLHDGPGIRTTVFLKGCPLHCLWCHNPEGVGASPSVSFLPEKCMACGECVRVCAHDAHRLEGSGAQGGVVTHVYNREACEKCGSCAEYCDSGSLEFVGRPMSVDDVMKEIIQDRTFYASSGGGMTISGGEPLVQIDFTIALLRAAREQGIHRCVETAGFASWERIRSLLPLVNLFLYDCKELDAERHKDFTGQSNLLILENLRSLHAAGAKVQLQCPIIPGWNDREDHFKGIAALAQSLPHLEGVLLLPYHPLGESKLQRFGLSPATNMPRQPLDPAQLDHWANWLRGQGVRVVNTPSVPTSASPH